MYFGYKLGELTENNKALLFLSGKDTIQSFNGSIKAVTLLFAKRLTSELPYLQILQRSNFRLIWFVNQIVLFNGFLSDFVEISSCVYTKTIILYNLGEYLMALEMFSSPLRGSVNIEPLFTKKVPYFNFTILIPSFSESVAELRYVTLRLRSCYVERRAITFKLIFLLMFKTYNKLWRLASCDMQTVKICSSAPLFFSNSFSASE